MVRNSSDHIRETKQSINGSAYLLGIFCLRWRTGYSGRANWAPFSGTSELKSGPCPASLVRSVQIVELARADKHNGNGRSKHHDGDEKDPGALDDHIFLRSPLPPPAPRSDTEIACSGVCFTARSLQGALLTMETPVVMRPPRTDSQIEFGMLAGRWHQCCR
jgi:hypothetical protein